MVRSSGRRISPMEIEAGVTQIAGEIMDGWRAKVAPPRRENKNISVRVWRTGVVKTTVRVYNRGTAQRRGGAADR